MILIANLGNRNLKYEGEDLKEFFDSRRSPAHARWYFQRADRSGKTRWLFDFRALTADLLARYDEVKEALSAEIFAEFLETGDEAQPHVTDVYLLTTNQADPRFQYTDTLHEGEILERFLREELGVARVHLRPTHVNPTHEADLFNELAPLIRAILAAHPVEKGAHPAKDVRFVDAGGTPQLKSVAKELLRYYATERLEIRYTADDQDGAARDVNSPLHDKYVLLRTAREFVKNYDYAGALAVLGQVDKTTRVSADLPNLLRIANYRLQFNHADAKRLAHQLTTIPDGFTDFIALRPPADAVDFEDFQRDKDRFDIFEIASITQLLLLEKREYAPGILSFIRLLEEIGQNLAENRESISSLQDRDGQYKFIQRTQVAVVARYPVVEATNGRGEKNVLYGIPYLMAYVLTCGSPALQVIAETVKPAISHLNGKPQQGINLLRNKTFFTHQNQGVTAQSIQEHDRTPPGFLGPDGRAARIFRLLGLPAVSVYDQMNDALLHLFQQE